MKAAYINRTGPPDVIVYGDLPEPKPARLQCLIKVGAVDVNPIDTYIRSGALRMNLSFPYIVGRGIRRDRDGGWLHRKAIQAGRPGVGLRSGRRGAPGDIC